MRRLLITVLVLAASAVLAPAALATTETATSGAVTATFTYTGQFPNFSGQHLTIAQSGTVLYDQPVTAMGCGSGCAPGNFGTKASAVHVIDLDHTGQPNVVLDLFTGGAHCCFVSRFYRWDGTTYVPSDRNWGDPGYRIADLDGDGVKELITADDRFAYAFTAFAFSLLPVRIYDLRAGSWQLVTKRFPARIRADARANWRAFKKAGRQNEPRGAIAAWAADQYLLGHRAYARRTLAKLARHRHLPGQFPPKSQGKFVRDLVRFLGRHGY